MSETEKILARARLALRRESGQWSRSAPEPDPVPGASDAIEEIPFYPDASMDTSFSLSQANLVHNAAALTPANRFKLPKRMLLRFVRFYTDRQVRFNASVTQVLNGYAKLLNRLAESGESLKHESASRLRQLQDRSSALEAGLVALREGSASEHEATRRLVASELEQVSTDLSCLRGEGETRDKLLKELGDELGDLRRETLRDFARSAEHHGRAIRELREELTASLERERAEISGALRGELATLRDELLSRSELLHREASGAAKLASTMAERHEGALGELRDAVAALRNASDRQEWVLQETSAKATAAGVTSERHESVLGELREAVAFLRGASDGQLQMFRDGLGSLRSVSESHDRRLQDVSATAHAAADATRRIDRSLEELATLAHTAKRDVALSGGLLTELRDAVPALRDASDAHDRAIQAAAASDARLEGLLADLRGAVTGLRTASEVHDHAIQTATAAGAHLEGFLAELRDELGSLRKTGEIQEGALREAAATAAAAADATRRIDRDLANVSGATQDLGHLLGAARASLGATESQLAAARAELSSLVSRGRGLQPDRVAQLYARFEERFRGSPEDIRKRVEVYSQRVARVIGQFSGLPFLDLGCGRGELVAALRDAGIHAEGIEANPIFAEACRSAGIPVHQSDLFEELRRRPDGSLAGISAIQVVEHLQAEALVEFLELARAKIAESGLLVLETIDVRSLYALRWFFADPTHVLPLMPETLGFYVENAGFTELEVMPLHPVPEPVAPPPGGGKRIERVTEVVFGPQDFALIARRPPVRRLPATATPSAPAERKPRARRRSGRRPSAARGKARSGSKAPVRTAVRRDRRSRKS